MRVYLTVNPRLVAGARFQTVRSMVTALAALVDLRIVPVDGIDFRRGRVEAWRRLRGGRFERAGTELPRGALWINYSDGFYLDHAALGFASPGAFLAAQHALYDQARDSGRIGRVVNTASAERATLKTWLAGLDPDRYGVIPSYRLKVTTSAAMRTRLDELRRRHGAIVAKPDWGGASQGVVRIASAEAARDFAARHGGEAASRHPFDAWCVQPLADGAEKRLWFAGSSCVGGRILLRRPKPWDPYESRSWRIERYYFGDPAQDPPAGRRARIDGVRVEFAAQFRRDLATAHKLWRASGLEIGSVDFIGERVNELNGCGTTFTQYNGWRCVTDSRAPLVAWLRALIASLRA